MEKRKKKQIHEILLFNIEYFTIELAYISSYTCVIFEYHPFYSRICDLLNALVQLKEIFRPDQIVDIQKRLAQLAKNHEKLVPVFDEVKQRMNPCTTLEKLEPGSVFKTKDGILAVKSRYFYSDEPGAQCECVLLESGKHVHFPDKNSTLVIKLK